MGRAPCCDKANVKKGPWSPEEDAKLKAYIEEHGTGGNWIALPQKIGLRRCGKSCRLRWLNYLRPNIKHGGFSEEEDSIICSLYISIGSRWSIIAAQLPGRTDNDIKNYWNTKLKKRLLGSRHTGSQSESHRQDELQRSENDRPTDMPSQALSSSAIERMQLHMQLHGPFSFYNSPLLWPKFHPLAAKTPENQLADNSNITTAVLPNSTVIEPISEPLLLLPSELDCTSAGNMQHEELDSAATLLQAELHDLLYTEDSDRLGDELISFGEFDCEQRITNCWPINNCFEEKSSTESWTHASLGF